ncbi:uncharacterized protein LOC126713744 isoform X2 [Quercus robur]|uniref:uncharacterized protein LOC126713744 isoform X2 n=1 Tax=Quercus robur TaxID=38942 RepID=UPI002161D332|nr:uncharacterized protein LOC126713744 isoform X2 [Quercus robur]XP_050269551.1 uncharacterized protein LOC126713744 isoform X2 [Quercus robur]XP_050269552.1 uncharacterized protein LOC126713744 isoform X2 [Quercus robur]XP_050269553.1 uncharacterized protein LOC126713744 isoform X2 [Quercus robur]
MFGEKQSKNSVLQNMPQDGLRSVVYRSFVTCDDSKGVVNCKTIKKSRTGSQQMDHKNESQRTRKNSNTAMAYYMEREDMVSKGFTEEVHSPSSFQVMEVSRGAQKLNQMIDSWSKGVIFDGQSKDIAQDLLKGALDLQESLVMLGKSQEASLYMSQVRKKPHEKSESRRIDEMEIRRTNSSPIGDQNCSMGFQKPRISTDGSSRNQIEELKKVIRDSLAKQNLLPNLTTQETGYLHQRDLSSASEIPSTSSNQSLNVDAYDFDSPDSSLSSKAPQKKEKKGPNLIAKLMGLEDLPSKTSQNTLQKHLERERISNQRRPIFDIDMPKGRKPQSIAQRVNPERKTLKEILDTLQFKGLLRSNSIEELKPQSDHSNNSHSKQRVIDEIPPIVLIKPFRVPRLVDQLHTAVLREEKSFNTKKMLRKLTIKRELSFNTHKEGALSSKKMHCKMEVEEEETPIKTLSIEEVTREHKEVVRKPEGKEIKPKEKVSHKLKASVPVDHRLQTKEAIVKKLKADRFQNNASASRKPLKMENKKGKIVSRCKDQATVTSTKPRKSGNVSNSCLVNNQISRKPSTTQNTSSKHATKTISSSDQKKNQMKKKKPVRELTAIKSIENFGSKEDDMSINFKSEICSPLIRIDTTLADQFPVDEEKDASESNIGEHCSNSQSSLSDVTPVSPKHEMDEKTVEEAYDYILHSRKDIKSFKSGNNLKHFLLSSPSFLTHAEELFDLDVCTPTILLTSCTSDFIEANVRLSLECANELIERKSLRGSQTVHPLLLTHEGNLRVCTSVDKLLEEVCSVVESLRRYSKFGGELLPQDSLYSMLERDISCNGIENGIWDFSWRYEFSADDAEQVATEIEKLVFCELIEEVLT